MLHLVGTAVAVLCAVLIVTLPVIGLLAQWQAQRSSHSPRPTDHFPQSDPGQDWLLWTSTESEQPESQTLLLDRSIGGISPPAGTHRTAASHATSEPATSAPAASDEGRTGNE